MRVPMSGMTNTNYLVPYELVAPRRRRVAFNTFTHEIHESGGEWQAAEIEGNKAIVRARLPERLAHTIARHYPQLTDTEAARVWAPRRRPRVDAYGDLVFDSPFRRTKTFQALCSEVALSNPDGRDALYRAWGAVGFGHGWRIPAWAKRLAVKADLDPDRWYRLASLVWNEIGAFPTTGLLDNFNTGTGALSSNWSTLSGLGAGTPSVDTNAWVAGDGYEGSYWNAATFGPNCEVYATTSNAAGGGIFFGALLKLVDPGSAGAADAYGYHYSPDNDGELYIVEYTNGSETELTARTAFTTLSDGDGLGGEAIADVLKLYTRETGTWTERASVSDTTLQGTSGNLGLHSFDPGGIDLRLDDFSGGTIAASETITMDKWGPRLEPRPRSRIFVVPSGFKPPSHQS